MKQHPTTLPKDCLPQDFVYPAAYLELLQSDTHHDLDPWEFLTDRGRIQKHFHAFKNAYPSVPLIPFAVYSEDEKIFYACFTANGGEEARVIALAPNQKHNSIDDIVSGETFEEWLAHSIEFPQDYQLRILENKTSPDPQPYKLLASTSNKVNIPTYELNDKLRDEIYALLEKAKNADYHYKQFGAHSHKYSLNPPVNPEVLQEIENTYNFKFPEEYFWFMTCVGNGGAGPDYGIFPIGIEKVDQRNTVDDRKYHHARETPMHLACDPDEWKSIVDNCDDDLFEKEIYGGMVIIGTKGCFYLTMLVITGEHRGSIVYSEDEYVDPHHFPPGGQRSFLHWYIGWLQETAAGYQVEAYGYKCLGTPEEILSDYDNSNETQKLTLFCSLRKTKNKDYPDRTPQTLGITDKVCQKLHTILTTDTSDTCRKNALMIIAALELDCWQELVRHYMLKEEWVSTCATILWSAYWYKSDYQLIAPWQNSLIMALPITEKAIKNGHATRHTMISLLERLHQGQQCCVDEILPLVSDEYSFDVFQTFLHREMKQWSENHWEAFFNSVRQVITEYLNTSVPRTDTARLRKGLFSVRDIVDAVPESGQLAKALLLPTIKTLQAEFRLHTPDDPHMIRSTDSLFFILCTQGELPPNLS